MGGGSGNMGGGGGMGNSMNQNFTQDTMVGDKIISSFALVVLDYDLRAFFEIRTIFTLICQFIERPFPNV